MTITTSRPAITNAAAGATAPGGDRLRQARERPTHSSLAPAGSTPHPTDRQPTSITRPSDGAQHASGPGLDDTRSRSAAGVQSADRQMTDAAQGWFAVGSTSGPDPVANAGPTSTQRSLLDPALALAADVLDDIERVRTANENRLRQMTRSVEDSDGELRGFGYDETHPDVARLAAIVEMLKKVEHDATLQLQRQLRRHPLGAWVKATKGVGEKQGARLLAAIGDPYINSAKNAPRTVSALWAYCGLHVVPGQASLDAHSSLAGDGGDPGQNSFDSRAGLAGVAPKRRRGEQANWSTKAKTKAYLIAEACMKQLSSHCRTSQSTFDDQTPGAGPAVRHTDECTCSPYRVVYDNRRAHTAVSRPDWSDGHSHNDALRVVSKEILKDLWRAARDWHLSQGGAE